MMLCVRASLKNKLASSPAPGMMPPCQFPALFQELPGPLYCLGAADVWRTDIPVMPAIAAIASFAARDFDRCFSPMVSSLPSWHGLPAGLVGACVKSFQIWL